jgi:hypothetical protein
LFERPEAELRGPARIVPGPNSSHAACAAAKGVAGNLYQVPSPICDPYHVAGIFACLHEWVKFQVTVECRLYHGYIIHNCKYAVSGHGSGWSGFYGSWLVWGHWVGRIRLRMISWLWALETRWFRWTHIKSSVEFTEPHWIQAALRWPSPAKPSIS